MENTIESRTIKEPVDIYWNEDSSLKSYKLEYIKRETEATFKEPKDAESSYIKINEGTNASKNSVLGTFDPTLMENGLYKVRLIGIKEDNKEVKMTAIYLVTGGMKIGNFTLSNDDLNIPLAGLPITVTRNYDSRKSNQKGDFGNGWDLGLSNLKLEITSNIGEKGWYQQITKSGFFSLYEIKESKEHKVTITYPTGEVEEFSVGVTPNSQRLYPIENVKMTFTAKNGSKATLRDLDEKYFWVSGGASASGSNLELISSSGDGFNPTKFEYTDKNGIKYIISKANGVEKIIYLDGDYVLLEKEKLTYKSASDNTEKIVNIVRDSTNKITQINDFDGKSIKYEYDSNNNLTKVIDREGRETSYSYANNKLVGIKGYKDITPARYEYDNNNRMTAYIDSYGARTEYSFNEGVKQYVVKDAMGYVSIYEYDSRGNIISYTDKENNKTLYEYDDNDKLIKETDCLGNIYKYEYSKEGNLLSKEDPLGNKREATYNRFGEMLTISDAEKNIITNDYDSNGRLIEAKDPYGNIQKFTYTRDEKPESITDALGKVKKFTYDEKNHLKTMTDENGNVTNYVYDDEGRCLSKSIEVTKGEAKEIVTVSYQYDKYNNIIKATDSKGNSTTYEYKGNTDLVVKATDKNGRVTRYEYDDYGNVSKVIYPDNTYETYTYDKLRNMLKSIDANGYETKYAYDKMSRLSKVEYPNGLIINYTYDGNGNLLKVKSSDLKEVNYTYDSAGRNTEVKDALGKITKYNYDKNGNIIEQIDANGNSIKYEYDKLGRKTKITVGDISTSCTYDAIGRIASKTDGEGNTTSYEYDATSNLIGVTDALGNKTSYKYNEIGKLIEETDANGNATKYEYDTLGRTISRTLPLGQKESYEYDNNSNLISVIDFNGRKSTYTYDKKNQLTSKKLADGKITKYSYDKKGQLLSVKDNTGTIKLEYDNVGNLKSKTDVNGEKIEYTYDYQGNILSLKTPNTISKYAYDKAGKLLSVEDKYGNKTSYTYDNVGNLIKEIKGNNSYTSYEYDKAYRLIKLTNYKSSGQIISSYKYSLDKRGLRTKVEENNGKVTEYKYDELGRLLSEKVIKASKTTETKYSYDKVSNRISKIEDGKKIKYSYDKNNRLLKEGNISYTYDKAGNLTKKQSTSETISYIYRLDGKLGTVKKTVGTKVTNESYRYNAFGTRIAKITDGKEERYLVDENTDYSGVLEEKDKDNNLTVEYTYGLDLVSQKRDGKISYYNKEGLGSVTSLSSETGAVTDTYSYDANGNVKERTGKTKNNYLFAGEEKDNTTGNYYLRARYMDPSIGRFISMDSYLGSVSDPVSLHKYLYANANPVNYTDPSGNCTLIGLVLCSVQEAGVKCSELNIKMLIVFGEMSSTLVGKVFLEELQELYELAWGGDFSLEGFFWSQVDVICGLVGNETDFSQIKKRISPTGNGDNPKLYRKMSVAEAELTLEGGLQPGRRGTDPTKWTSESLEKVKEFDNKIVKPGTEEVIIEFEINPNYYKHMQETAVPQRGSKGNPNVKYHYEGLEINGPYRNYGITPEQIDMFNRNILNKRVIKK